MWELDFTFGWRIEVENPWLNFLPDFGKLQWSGLIWMRLEKPSRVMKILVAEIILLLLDQMIADDGLRQIGLIFFFSFLDGVRKWTHQSNIQFLISSFLDFSLVCNFSFLGYRSSLSRLITLSKKFLIKLEYKWHWRAVPLGTGIPV